MFLPPFVSLVVCVYVCLQDDKRILRSFLHRSGIYSGVIPAAITGIVVFCKINLKLLTDFDLFFFCTCRELAMKQQSTFLGPSGGYYRRTFGGHQVSVLC